MNAQHNEMTMDEMDQVNGGMYYRGAKGLQGHWPFGGLFWPL